MKNILKRGLALLLIVMIIVSSISISSFASVSKPSISNTGTRDEVCTTFNGTTAPQYYTGTYAYDNLVNLSSSSLLTTLRKLMTDTHKNESSYDNCHYYGYYTDCENGNTTYVTTLYTSYSADEGDWPNGWNREHVWPKSLGGNNTSGGGADLHHIRPSESGVNSSRGNKKYGETDNSNKVTSSKTGLLGGYSTSTYFEPLDNVKGDVARICLYVYVRWGSSWGADSITEVFQSVDVLLEWCALDPVDTWEMERNDVIQSVQGNRNVFIDYPELAWELFNKTAPTTMKSPSGKAASSGNGGSGDVGGGSDPCTHASVTTVNAVAATCGTAGYTGDSKCTSCGEIVTKGQNIPATGKHTETLVNVLAPSCADGYTGDVQCGDCKTILSRGEVIPAIGMHDEVTVGAMKATCNNDGYTGDIKCHVCDTLILKGTVIPAPESHDEITVGAKEATCTEEGYTGDIKCSSCDEMLLKGSVIPMLESHIFDVWMEVTPATENASGIMSRHCFICGYGEVDTIPKIEKTQSNNADPMLITIAISTPTVLIAAGVIILIIIIKKKA